MLNSLTEASTTETDVESVRVALSSRKKSGSAIILLLSEKVEDMLGIESARELILHT